MDNLPSPEQRREQHRAWLESWGFSDEDWRRIKLHAGDVTRHLSPPALVDLSRPVRVMAVLADDRRHYGGQVLGVVNDAPAGRVVLLAWPMTSREQETWAKRRREWERRRQP